MRDPTLNLSLTTLAATCQPSPLQRRRSRRCHARGGSPSLTCVDAGLAGSKPKRDALLEIDLMVDLALGSVRRAHRHLSAAPVVLAGGNVHRDL